MLELLKSLPLDYSGLIILLIIILFIITYIIIPKLKEYNENKKKNQQFIIDTGNNISDIKNTINEILKSNSISKDIETRVSNVMIKLDRLNDFIIKSHGDIEKYHLIQTTVLKEIERKINVP